jgi:heterodisulfide reductase subunit C/nitrate reductase gamma subunit
METKQIIFSLFLVASLSFFAWTMMRLINLLRLAKASPRWDRIPERISHTMLVAFGQSKIFRITIAGTLHALVFWGFMVITFGTAEMMIDGVAGTERAFHFMGPVYSFMTASGDIFAAIILVSCVIFLFRRYVTKPARFTAPEMKPKSRNDATVILSLIMILMVSLIGLNMAYSHAYGNLAHGAYPISRPLGDLLLASSSMPSLFYFHETCWWIHILIVLGFLNLLPYSKHFHVILSIPNVFFKRLEPAGKLNNLDSVTHEIKIMMGLTEANADAPPPSRFGVKDMEDVTWKTALDSFTCTECGRCTASCPANITGKKLSPRKLYIDLRKRVSTKGPELVKDAKFEDGKTIFDYISAEELWACTTCGACMEECPVDIEHVPFIIDMRRYLVMEESKAPAALNNMFANIENNGSPWAISASSRFDWATGIEMDESKFATK